MNLSNNSPFPAKRYLYSRRRKVIPTKKVLMESLETKEIFKYGNACPTLMVTLALLAVFQKPKLCKKSLESSWNYEGLDVVTL